MPKSKTEQQTEAIRRYVKKGYSANQIQVKLREQHIGMRRKILLTKIRIIKHQKPKAETVKYIPKKYAKVKWRTRAKRIRLRPLGEKQVTLTGLHKGKLISKTQRGSGKDLYRFVKDEMTGDYWNEKPHIHS